MNVIILAAGRGTRFSEDTPKCLCALGTETIMSRQIKQVREHLPDAKIVVVVGFEHTLVQEYAQSFDTDIEVCYNKRYQSDQNIYSCLRGIESIGGGALILEGDCIFSDEAFVKIKEALEEDDSDSMFFLGAAASMDKTNGIVKIDAKGKFSKYNIGERDDVAGYYNMTGATWIPADLQETYLSELEALSKESMSQYYFQPLLNNSRNYGLRGEVIGDACYTFNTKEEYLTAYDSLDANPVVELYDVSKLKHIEDYDRDAVKKLKRKIKKDGKWIRPLCISPEGYVMDGQHRMEVAKELELTRVPVIVYQYEEVPIYSLREDESFRCRDVKRRAKKGDIYPYKTVKHIFNEDDLICEYTLEELK